MKKIYLTAFSLLFATSGIFAQTSWISSSKQPATMKTTSSIRPMMESVPASKAKALAANEMYVSYCQNASPFLRLGTVKPYDIATYFDKMIIGKYVGDKVTKLRVAVSSKPKALTIWLREKLNDAPIFSQEIPETDLPEEGWIEVELPADKVYTIKESGYYVGYTMTEQKVSNNDDTYYPIAIAPDGVLPKNTLLISEDGGKSWADYTYTYYPSNKIIAAAAAQTAIASDKHMDYDLSLNYFQGDFAFIKRNPENDKATIDFNGYIFNAGKKPITNFDLTVSAEGIEPVTIPLKAGTGIPMFKGTSFRYSIDVPNNMPSIKIDVQTSNLNNGDNVDGYAGNDKTSTEDIVFYETDTVKTSLVEMYTTTQCPNCPYGHKVINALPKSCNKVLVAHHVGYYTDEFTMDESYNYMYEFGVTGAPTGSADRTFIADEKNSSFSLGYTNPSQGAIQVNKYITFTQNVLPAFASIAASSTYDENSRELTVKVYGRKVNAELFDKAVKRPHVNVFLTEDGLKAKQSGAMGLYTHDHVLRAILGDIWGNEITWNGDNYTVEFKATVSADWNPDNMNIVAFLTDEDYDSRYYHHAMNATQIDLKGDLTSIENSILADLSIEAVNGTIHVTGDYDTYHVYNMQGIQIENSNLTKGIYLVKVQTGSKTAVHKTIVD